MKLDANGQFVTLDGKESGMTPKAFAKGFWFRDDFEGSE
jgi:hypothetical protein